MSSESDGTGKADNLEVIRKLLQKLEEAATVDGKRSASGPGAAARADAELSRAAAARPKPPVLEAKPLAVAEQQPGRELSSLQRGMVPARAATPSLQRVPDGDLAVTKPIGIEAPVQSRSRSPVVAISAFALGAVTAAGLVSYFEPFKLLQSPASQTTSSSPHGGAISATRDVAGEAKQAEAAPAPTAVAAAPALEAAAPATPAETSGRTAQPTEAVASVSAGGEAAAASPDREIKAEAKVATAAPIGSASTPEMPPPAAQAPVPSSPAVPEARAAAAAPPKEPTAVAQAAKPVPAPVAKPSGGAPGSVALSVPRRIEGRPGSRQVFPMKLEPMPREDQHLLVVLRGMPEWASMSKGSVIDTELWLLPAHTADGLEIELSLDAKESADLRVELATLDGRLLARAPTTLVVNRTELRAPATIVELKSPPLDQQAILHLLARGDLLLDTGDFDAAREVYRTAAEAGSAGAALKLGQTYDPAEVDRLGMTRKVADEAMARRWYELARSLGSTLANDRLSTMGRQ